MTKVAFIQKKSFEKLSVHYLASALRANNIDYDLFIYDLEENFWDRLVEYKPSFVVYSLLIGEEVAAFEYFRKVKELLPHAKTLVGGTFTLLFPEICNKEEVDFVFRGDGEFSLPEFIRLFDAGENVKNIPGICYVDGNGQEFRNDMLGLNDVNSIPEPDRDLYYKYDTLKNNPTKIFIASRGCPYQCTFCYNAELTKFFEARYWRLRNVQDVIEEIQYVRDKYGLKWVHFQDGTFNANKKWLTSFLDAYSKTDLPDFMCNARVENIDEEIIYLLKKARCNRITFGIQSGNPRIRNEVALRATSNQQIIDACRLCNKHGIRFSVDVIFGWPSETLEEAMDTIRLCRQVKAETCSSNVLVFYPGLRITKYAYEKKYIEKIPTLEDIHSLNFNTSLLISKKKKLFINIDKLFNYLIKFPRLEKIILYLLILPPNRLFLLLKNIHLLARSLKYDETSSKSSIIMNYITSNWKAET